MFGVEVDGIVEDGDIFALFGRDCEGVVVALSHDGSFVVGVGEVVRVRTIWVSRKNDGDLVGSAGDG